MIVRFLNRLLSASGYRLVSRKALEEQRAEMASQREDLAGALKTLAAERDAHVQGMTAVWSKVETERRRRAAASQALAAARESASRMETAAQIEAGRAADEARLRRAEQVFSEALEGSSAAERDPVQWFDIGRAFQTQGDISLAVEAYRKVGPAMPELLAQDGPDGDRVTGPDFIIIGAPRSGTTWLKKSLSQHERVFMLSREQHYFSNASSFPPEVYVERFASAHSRFLRPGMKSKRFARPAGRLYGEKSASYLSMPESQIDLCKVLFPDARLICMVRDPVERAWSHIKHIDQRGAGSLGALGDMPIWGSLDELIRMGRYEEHLVRWARRYDPAQMLLIDFARLAKEPGAVYQEVLRHIGAEPSASPAKLDDVGGTDQLNIPPEIESRLRDALGGERFDVPYLREAMIQAAGAAPDQAQGQRWRKAAS